MRTFIVVSCKVDDFVSFAILKMGFSIVYFIMETCEINELTYQLDRKNYTAKIIKNNDLLENVFIPLKICYKSKDFVVTTIGPKSFSENKNLKIISFPDDSRVNFIDDRAFYRSSLVKINIPKFVTHIGNFSFAWCNCIEEINIPDDSQLLSIGENAFFISHLQTLKIPSKLEKLAQKWCKGTSNLTNIQISPENKNFSFIDNSLLISRKEPTLIFSNRNVRKVVIPASIEEILDSSFECCFQIRSIEFEKNSKLKKIGQSSFESSSIPRIKIPSTVTSISGYAFSTCQKLEYVEFEKDAKIENFGFFAFFNSAIKHFTCPATANNIGGYMLQQCDDLICAEFLGDKLKFNDHTFYFCQKILYISFPNSKTVDFGYDDFFNVSDKCSLFFVPYAKITIKHYD